MKPKDEIEKAVEHVRRAAEAYGTDLDEVMRELCIACTALKQAERLLITTKDQPGRAA